MGSTVGSNLPLVLFSGPVILYSRNRCRGGRARAIGIWLALLVCCTSHVPCRGRVLPQLPAGLIRWGSTCTGVRACRDAPSVAKVTNIVFVFTFSFQILVSVFFGRSFIGNWVQAVTGLLSVKMVQIHIRKSAIEQHQQAWSMKENSTYYSMMQRIETGNKSSNGPTGSSSSGMFNRLHNASQHEQHEKIYREYQNRQKRHLYQLRIQREMLNEEKRDSSGCRM